MIDLRTTVLSLALAGVACAQVGMVLSVQGDVKVSDAKGTRPAAIADVITDGAKLALAKQAKVQFLFCPQAASIDASGPGEISFSASSFESRSIKPVTRKISACRLPPSGASSRRIGGLTLRGDNPLVLTSPANARAHADKPQFSWVKVEGAERYRITVKSESQELLWEKETAEPRIEYAGKPLERGKRYRWAVTALQGEEVLSSASAWMMTLTEAEESQIVATENDWPDKTGTGRALALAFLYEELDMPSEALEHYQMLPTKSAQIEERVAALEKRLKPQP